jgi:preprotein translocase subunit SecE
MAATNAIVSYVRESAEELRKVVWPSRKTVVRDTAVVLGASIVMALFFGALDFGLTVGMQKLIEFVQARFA